VGHMGREVLGRAGMERERSEMEVYGAGLGAWGSGGGRGAGRGCATNPTDNLGKMSDILRYRVKRTSPQLLFEFSPWLPTLPLSIMLKFSTHTCNRLLFNICTSSLI
jgi:hypothetical protein